LTGVVTLSEAIDSGEVQIEGDLATAKSALGVFDIDGLRS
jgi:hypothetical protein